MGSGPVKLLFVRPRTCKLVKLPMPIGIDPLRVLFPSVRTCNVDIVVSISGNPPLKIFDLSRSSWSFGSCASDLGIVPENSFEDKFRCTKFGVILASKSGIGPLKAFFDRSRNIKLVQLRMNCGNAPLSLFLDTDRYSKAGIGESLL